LRTINDLDMKQSKNKPSLKKELVKFTVKEFLLSFVDAQVVMVEVFDPRGIYQRPIEEYRSWRENSKEEFSKKFYQLKKNKLIEVYKEDGGKQVQLTEKGKKTLLKYLTNDLLIEIPKLWDKKWRVVIFDIPETRKLARNVLREKLKELGFLKIQKSVFIFPYECQKEIDFLRKSYEIEQHVLYMVVESIETDVNLVSYFLKRELLHKE